MVKPLLLALFLSLLAGCGGRVTRLENPEDPQGPYSEQIAVARRTLTQETDWADRVEWEVLKTDHGWDVIAWRVEHPENKGAGRYLPWGYSIIELDHRMVAIHYQPHG